MDKKKAIIVSGIVTAIIGIVIMYPVLKEIKELIRYWNSPWPSVVKNKLLLGTTITAIGVFVTVAEIKGQLIDWISHPVVRWVGGILIVSCGLVFVLNIMPGGLVRYAAALVVVAIGVGLVYGLAQTLAGVVVLVLSLAAAFFAVKEGNSFGGILIAAVINGLVVGVITLPLFPYLKKG